MKKLIMRLLRVRSPAGDLMSPERQQYYRDLNAAYERGYRMGRMSGRITEAIQHIEREQ